MIHFIHRNILLSFEMTKQIDEERRQKKTLVDKYQNTNIYCYYYNSIILLNAPIQMKEKTKSKMTIKKLRVPL